MKITKICTKCGEEKMLSEFHKDNHNPDELTSQCKICKYNYLSSWRKKNKKYWAKLQRVWRSKNKKKVQKINKKQRIKQNPWDRCLSAIKQRCNNPNDAAYKNYGKRGIKNLFKNANEIKFLYDRDNAAQMKRPSIDRKDNDGNYCLENCRFIELSENVARRFKK